MPSRYAHAKTHVVARSIQPVVSDRGLGFLPTDTFETCPPLDVLCVPGGSGVADALADSKMIEFVGQQGRQARLVSSSSDGEPGTRREC